MVEQREDFAAVESSEKRKMVKDMAESLPSPPISETSQSDLVERLDELLEQYLELLDQYSTLREELSKSFSSGFFSLAQAQRSSSRGAGRRYGEDCYDERMKGQRRVDLTGDVGVEVERRLEVDDERDARSRAEQSKEDENKDDHSETVSETVKSTGKKKQNPATRDPLTWFGILAPPALKQTQRCFVEAVEKSIPALINVDSKMEDLEGEIWSVRKDLGVLDQYLTEPVDIEPPVDVNQKGSNPSKRKSLATRPAHTKSPLLTLAD